MAQPVAGGEVLAQEQPEHPVWIPHVWSPLAPVVIEAGLGCHFPLGDALSGHRHHRRTGENTEATQPRECSDHPGVNIVHNILKE